MAYITSERVAEIRKELKSTFPKWKFSITRENYSTVNIIILKADINLIKEIKEDCRGNYEGREYLQVNHYYLKNIFTPISVETLQKISDIANSGNHDNSDSQSDYFDVGFYVNISIGDYNKPFIFLP